MPVADTGGVRLAMDSIIAGKMMPMAEPLRSVDVVRVRGRERGPDTDCAATEEPLEVRLHDRPFAVIMRTPAPIASWRPGFCSPSG